jgi:hypothetical protein
MRPFQNCALVTAGVGAIASSRAADLTSQHVPSGACLFIGRVTDPR